MYTDINIVLDRSGSMQSVKPAIIEGFNSFIEAQKEVAGEAKVSLYQFDNYYETVYAGINVKEAPLLNNETFIPKGWTALLGAIGKTIDDVGSRLRAMPENERPKKVLIVIVTDGGENASFYYEWSRQYTNDKTNAMIKHQDEKYNWQFVFIGSNQDAIKTAGGLGIAAGNASTYDNTLVGNNKMWRKLSDDTKQYRSSDLVKTSNFCG